MNDGVEHSPPLLTNLTSRRALPHRNPCISLYPRARTHTRRHTHTRARVHTSDTGVADGASQRQVSGADAARGRMPPLPSKYPVTAGRADRSVPRVPYVHTDGVCPASPRDADGSVASARAVFHTHPRDANSSGDMATTRATPTTRATGCLQGFDRPAGWRFDHTGGFHLQRPAPKPTQLPPRPHRRRASIERRVDG